MPVTTKKPIAWFKPDPNQPRKTFDEAELRQLGEDMRNNGQHHAVVALPEGTLICGGRRLAAARLVGLPELEVKIYDQPLTATQIKVIQLTENLHRTDLTDQDVYLAVSELRRLNPTWQKQDLAAHLHRSPSAITRILSVDDLIPAAREAFLGKAFGCSVAYEISKASSAQEQHELLAAKLAGASRDQMHQQARKARNGDRPKESTSRIKVEVASGITVTFNSKNPFDLDQAIKAAGDAAKLMKEGQVKGLSLKNIQKARAAEARNGA
jgi:ParB family chromosome partitioning protein